MSKKHTLTVQVTFDLDRVNCALGNTPNVIAIDALYELLRCAVNHYDDDLADSVFLEISD